MEIREIVEADLPLLLDLCQRTLPLDAFTPTLLRRRVLEEPDRNPAYQLVAWEDDRLVGVILGGVREIDEGRMAWVRLITVDPAYRRRGIASQLLEELEGRLRADGLTRLRLGNSAPNYFWPGLDVRYTPAICFFQHHGFHRIGEAVDMEVDLTAHDWDTSEEEARLAREGFLIRRLQPEDRESISAWLQERWSPVWHYEVLSSYENDPISTFVATREDRICAFASYNVTMFENGFGPMGTEPDLRGRGIGRVLFWRCMRDMKALGHRTADICWVGPIAFYARVADARIHRVFWWMEKEL
ncbi:MAG TPA: GNAT family N-acetyltransferase [Caldilineae bacterium]|nr:GNAT family N-acetyltransferase [Caldilineae bacterium]